MAGNCKDGLKLAGRRIALVMWKNGLLRKRQRHRTLIEVAVPVFMVLMLLGAQILVAWMVFNTSLHDMWSFTQASSEPYNTTEQAMFNATTAALLQTPRLRNQTLSTSAIAYAPFTPLTEAVMKEAMIYLGLPSMHIEHYDTISEIEDVARKGLVIVSPQSVLRAAIVFGKKGSRFKGDWGNLTSDYSDGHEFTYKIRLFSIDYEKETKETSDRQTGTLYLRTIGANGRSAPELASAYTTSGFSGLQIAIDKSIMKLVLNLPFINEEIDLAAFPYQASLDFHHMYFIVLPLLLVFGFAPMVVFIILSAANERASGIKELAKLMGLPAWVHWVGWMLNSLILSMITITIMVVLLLVPFVPQAGAFIVMSHLTFWWFVLLLFVIAATACALFLSTLFEDEILAAFVGFFLWICSYGIVLCTCGLPQHYPSFSTKMATSLLPPVALHWAVVALCSLQGLAVASPDFVSGAKWGNIALMWEEISVGYCCLMLIVDAIVYMLLAVYLDNVIPRKHGAPKPLYYIFQLPKWMTSPSNKPNAVAPLSQESSIRILEVRPGYEPDPQHLTPTVELKNVTKRYGKNKFAVNELSCKLYEDQITVFLGPSGAGKTTTVSMLAGMFSPTSGKASSNEFGTKPDADHLWTNIGLCPQKNMLFGNLSVREHLLFFAMLKQLPYTNAYNEATKFIEHIGMEKQERVISKRLSAGQKRKLCLGIALICGSRLVLVDEPTTGIDNETRWAMWDILLESRESRTILVTTTCSDEADVLGDRVVIMNEGEAKCSGTPKFLTHHFGASYTLKLTLMPIANREHILATVRKYTSNASFKDTKSTNSPRLAISVPAGNGLNSNIITELSNRKAELGIVTIGLHLRAIEDIFASVSKGPRGNSALNGKSAASENALLPKLKGAKLGAQQFMALLLKRFQYAIRRPLLLFGQFLFPLAMLILAILSFSSGLEKSTTTIRVPALKMQLSDYSRPVTLFSFVHLGFNKKYPRNVGPSAREVKNVKDEIQRSIGEDPSNYMRKYIVGAVQKPKGLREGIVAMFSPSAIHSSALSINLISNAIFEKLNHTKKYNIKVSNQPIKYYDDQSVLGLNEFSMLSGPIIFSLLVKFGLCLPAAIFIVFPLAERICKAQHIQLMTGVSLIVYWGSSLLWDNFLVWILAGLMVVCLVIFDGGTSISFSDNFGYAVFFFIIVAFGFAAITFAYLFHNLFGTVTGGFIWLIFLHIFTEWIFLPILICIQILSVSWLAYFLWIVHVILVFLSPMYGLTKCIEAYVTIASNREYCIRALMGFRKSCNINSLQMTRRAASQLSGGLEMAIPGLLLDIILLFLFGIVYLGIFFAIEYKAFSRLIQDFTKHQPLAGQHDPAPRQYVHPDNESSPITQNQLHKQDKSIPSVSNRASSEPSDPAYIPPLAASRYLIPQSKSASKSQVPNPAANKQAPNQSGNKQVTKQAVNKQGPNQAGNKQGPKQAANKQAPNQAANKQAPNQAANKQAPKLAANKQGPNQAANKQAPVQGANKQAPVQAANKQAPVQAANIQIPPKPDHTPHDWNKSTNVPGEDYIKKLGPGEKDEFGNKTGGHVSASGSTTSKQEPHKSPRPVIERSDKFLFANVNLSKMYEMQDLPKTQDEPPPTPKTQAEPPPTPKPVVTTSQIKQELIVKAMAKPPPGPPISVPIVASHSRQTRSNGARADDDFWDMIHDSVETERKRVEELLSSGRVNDDALVVYQLDKQYGNVHSVNNLSFGVHHGERFGVIGWKGAGKSTALRMITGALKASSGTAYAQQFVLNREPRTFLQNIGYSPSLDPVIGVLTGKQMLELFCRLRGIPGSAAVEAEKWLDLIDLSEFGNVQYKKYNMGMQRRLNAAMAMIGDPVVILLDEPTSGLDPVAQRQYWDLISSLQGSEQSMVIASDNMAECEALCSRFGIIVNGELEYVGGAGRLKSRHSKGCFTLVLKLKRSLNRDPAVSLQDEIKRTFNPSVLKEHHQNILKYEITSTSMSFVEIFQSIENLKTKHQGQIEEYSVSDTNPEEAYEIIAEIQHGESKIPDQVLLLASATAQSCSMIFPKK